MQVSAQQPPLTYYYAKGSSALAAHILLEEVGADYTAVEVSTAQGAHRDPAYLRLAPKGRVPVLQTPHGVISENPAILEYIAQSHPDASCVPSGLLAQAQARSLASYLCSTVHVGFAHHKRGTRWADTSEALDDMARKSPEVLVECATLLESTLPFGPWALGDRYCFCDPYLFLLGRWMDAVGTSLDGFPKLKAHSTAMRARPATQHALGQHDMT